MNCPYRFYDGKPLPTRVWATYGGFSQRYMTFAYCTEMENTDVGHIKISQPGVWIVRAEHIDDTKTDTYDPVNRTYIGLMCDCDCHAVPQEVKA